MNPLARFLTPLAPFQLAGLVLSVAAVVTSDRTVQPVLFVLAALSWAAYLVGWAWAQSINAPHDLAPATRSLLRLTTAFAMGLTLFVDLSLVVQATGIPAVSAGIPQLLPLEVVQSLAIATVASGHLAAVGVMAVAVCSFLMLYRPWKNGMPAAA